MQITYRTSRVGRAIVRLAFLSLLMTSGFHTFSFAEPPSIYPPQGVLGFKGLDNKSSPTAVADGRASDLLNVKFDITGALIKRPGYDDVGTILDQPDDATDEAFPAVQGIYYTKYSSGNTDTIAVSGGYFYRWDTSLSPDDWTLMAGAGTEGDNYQYIFTTALDAVIATNDQDKPFKIVENGGAGELDTTDLTDALTKAKCVVWYKNYLIFGNTVEASTERSTRFRWSNVGTIETWSNDDYIDISALGGQEIEGFGILYDNLYAFLTDSIYQISLVGGDEIFKVTKVVDGIGCIAKNSIQHVILQNAQQGLMFLDEDKKIYFFNGISAQYISISIETTVESLNATRLKYAVSAVDGTDYYLCASDGSSTENNLLLDFQYQLGEWSIFDQIDANAMARVYDTNNLEQTYFGSYCGFISQTDDVDLVNDVYGKQGTISGPVAYIDTMNSSTASGLQVIYDADTTFASSGYGAIMKITSGSGQGEERRIIEITTSGIMVETPFTTNPDATTVYTIGAIDGYYISKWYDCGEPARLKNFGELWYWADAEDAGEEIDVSYATDFSDYLSTETVSLEPDTADAIWGSAVWGVSFWGETDSIFRQTKFQNTGRYLKFKIQNDDVGENFNIYGLNILFWPRDIQ